MSGITNVKIVEVIRIETSVGKGTEEDPARIEVQYWDKSGKMLCKKSHLEDSNS